MERTLLTPGEYNGGSLDATPSRPLARARFVCEGRAVPWVKAILRGQKVYARADAGGGLSAEGGRVEIRYKPNDGRRYQARADNLEVVDPTPLPDDTCGAAEAVEKPGAKGSGPSATPAKAAGGASARAQSPAAPPAGSVIAYADGACSGNPGPSGLGVVLVDGPRRVEISEYLGEGTNNIAELTAVLRALGEVEQDRAIMIYTDSQYTIGVVQKGWKAKANQDLVAELRAALSSHPAARLAYVPGHAGVILNERADALAREAVSARKTRRDVFVAKPGPSDDGERPPIPPGPAGSA
jgi:ribonuclease HI